MLCSRAMVFRLLVVGCSLGALSLAGCEQAPLAGPATIAPTANPAGEDGAAPSRAIPLADVKLDVVDGDGYQVALDKHKGSVVLVDFWATWCEPCTENFPHIVDLHDNHEGEGLRVISFSCNEPKEEADVRQFLADHGASFDNLLTKFGNGTQTNDTFGIHGVPYYKLYDRKGELRFQFAEGHEDLEHGEPIASMDQRVAELLGEAP